jgi:pyruvate formate lyase activating enzyme
VIVNADSLVEARWWRPEADGRILCTLCPRYCKIPDGKRGFCFIRKARGGRLWTAGYGRTTGFAIDPIEKKPLNHFLPGSKAFSFGTAGCNLGCLFCQNWASSKAAEDEVSSAEATPEQVVLGAIETGCASIAYTYNEPTIQGEFVIDVARLARSRGVKNVLKTNGFVDPRAREEIYESIDAANVDLKAFTDDFYRKQTLSRLEPVLDTLRWIRAKTSVWLEVTTLVIPGLNDSDAELRAECDWIHGELGPDVPVHFSAFHPSFRMLDRPRTPGSTLERAREIAIEREIRFAYTGNVFDPEGQATRCPSCRELLVERDRFESVVCRLGADGRCPRCATRVPGRWSS